MGSEMCIRDSRYPLEQLSGFRFETNEAKHRGQTLMVEQDGKSVKLDATKTEHRAQFFKELDQRIESELQKQFDEISKRTQSITETIQKQRSTDRTAAALEKEKSKDVTADKLSVASFGALGSSAIEIQQSLTAVQQAYLSLEQSLDRIQDEKNYAAELDGINKEEFYKTKSELQRWANEQKKLAAQQVTFSSTNVSVSGGTSGFSTSVSTNPMQGALADARKNEVGNQVRKDLVLAEARVDSQKKERAVGLQKTLNELFRDFEAKVGTLIQSLLALEQAKNLSLIHI